MNCNLKLQDPTEKHFGDVGILDKYEDNNNNNKSIIGAVLLDNPSPTTLCVS